MLAYIGTVISMESASLSWIVDEEDANMNMNSDNNDDKDKPATSVEQRKDSESDAESANSNDNFLSTSETVCEGPNYGVVSSKTIDMDEQHSSKRSNHTLADISFRIKKGSSLSLSR